MVAATFFTKLSYQLSQQSFYDLSHHVGYRTNTIKYCSFINTLI